MPITVLHDGLEFTAVRNRYAYHVPGYVERGQFLFTSVSSAVGGQPRSKSFGTVMIMPADSVGAGVTMKRLIVDGPFTSRLLQQPFRNTWTLPSPSGTAAGV